MEEEKVNRRRRKRENSSSEVASFIRLVEGFETVPYDTGSSVSAHSVQITTECSAAVFDNIEYTLGQQTPLIDKSEKRKCDIISKENLFMTPLHVRDIPLPAVSWADSMELSLLMCFKEDLIDKNRDPNVFKKHPNLTPRMRAILFDWLMEVCDVYKLKRVTYYLAVDYVDRYLSHVEELPKNQLQLLGITCLFIAAKVEEVYPPKLAELAYVTDGACTDQEMILKEMAVLKVLNWDINPMTVSGWLNLYMQICYSIKTLRDCDNDRNYCDDDFIFPQFSAFAFIRASQLIDFCSLDDGMLQFQYSTIAASAIYYIFNRERALYVSGFTWEAIKDCVQWMAPFYKVVSQVQLFSSLESPKENARSSSGLKKENPNILVNEAYSVQTHKVSLKMLEDVYDLMHGKTCSSGSTEYTTTTSKESNSSQTPSPYFTESCDEESILDVDVTVNVKKQEKSSCV